MGRRETFDFSNAREEGPAFDVRVVALLQTVSSKVGQKYKLDSDREQRGAQRGA